MFLDCKDTGIRDTVCNAFREADGKDSIPYQKDRSTSRYGQKLTARRVARTIMPGSAPSTSVLHDQIIRGLEASRILVLRMHHIEDENMNDRWDDYGDTLYRA